MTVRVILLAGPSGAGKSRLAERLGLPVLQLDDFYKDGTDPSLPRFEHGTVDWDHPGSWRADDAVAAIREVCWTGGTAHPVYDISANAHVGHRALRLGEHRCFVAEGIFAAELIETCDTDGTLAAAICVRRSRWLTFVFRLSRDLRERRKPPAMLVRRGWWLARREHEIVASLVAKGCRAMTPAQAARHIRGLAEAPAPSV